MDFWIARHTKAKKGQEIDEIAYHIVIYPKYALDLLNNLHFYQSCLIIFVIYYYTKLLTKMTFQLDVSVRLYKVVLEHSFNSNSRYSFIIAFISKGIIFIYNIFRAYPKIR